ncbi:MAG: hypothetical protein RR937_06815 [Ruthenibacterium sp.]
MNLQEKNSGMGTKILQKLAQAKDAETLRTIAEKEGVSLTQEEAEGVFAALDPVRKKVEISEEDLQCISGGFIGHKRPIYVPKS